MLEKKWPPYKSGYWLTELGPGLNGQSRDTQLITGQGPQTEQCLPVLLTSLRWLETFSKLWDRKTGI